MSEIECTSYKEMNKGVMIAFVTVFVPKWGVEIFNVQLCEKGNQKWINFPSRQIEQNGEKKYLPHLRFKSREHTDAFAKKVWEAADKWKQTAPQEDDGYTEGMF
jgi:hypothetical protein